MKLKKRIYLLTPLLVLVCVIAAGVFMKAPAKVEAESYVVKKGTFNATKLSDALKDPSNTQYEIKEFDTYLFDYNGKVWNNYWEQQLGNSTGGYFFAFKNGDTGTKEAVFDVGMNSGGKYVKQGILDSELGNWSLPKLNAEGYSKDGYKTLVGAMLFAPTNDFAVIKDKGVNSGVTSLRSGLTLKDIRTAYKAKFEFVYDKVSGSYTYNSSANHAQFVNSGKDSDGDGLQEGKVELYTDTLSMTNGMVEQMSLTKDIYCVKNNANIKYTDYDAGYGQLSWSWQKGSLHYNKSANWVLDHTCFKLQKGTEDNKFMSHLRLQNFIKPSSGLNSYGWGGNRGDNYGDAVDSLNKNEIDYIYVKFKINSTDGTTDISGLAGNAFQLVLADTDGWMTSNAYTIKEETFSAGTYMGSQNYAKYEHIYTAKDLEGGFIELYFPINSNKGITFETIEQITLVPISSTDTNFIAKYNEKVAFDLYEFMIMYDEVAPNGGGATFRDGSSISSFLPFQKIENSYPGVESDGNLNANVGYNEWQSIFSKEIKLNYANRGIENTWWSQDTTIRNSDYYVESSDYAQRNNKPNDTTSYDGGLTDIKDKTGSALSGTGLAATYGSAAHFGMSMSVDFFIPLDRTNDGKDIRFEFTGDDDLWVFIDGQLVLDMGGTHWARTGAINFTKGNVFLDTYSYTDLSIKGPTGTINSIEDEGKALGTAKREGKDNGYTIRNDVKTTSWLQPGKHTMQVFYLERAAGVSNCYISFNLPLVPEGGLTVTKEIKEADDSEITLPKDLNSDGYDDLYTDDIISDDLVPVVKNEGGINVIGWTKPDGSNIDNNVEPLVYTFEATYKIHKAYNDLYNDTYTVYKYTDKNIVISDLDLVNINEPYQDGDYYVYNVRFQVPVGYSANILIPEDSYIIKVAEVDSTQNDDSIDSRFELGKTTLDTGNGEPTVGIDGNTLNNTKLTYTGEADGIKVDENTNIKLTFTNYYKAYLHNIRIEKIFRPGDPVPVDQNIVFKIEGDNLSEPLYVAMAIKATVDENNDPIDNPNIIIVKDLLKGEYIITEISDWSWRYECYDVVVQPDYVKVNIAVPSITLELDQNVDVAVTFYNELGEENWLDGEGSADNDFGDGTSTHYPSNSGN